MEDAVVVSGVRTPIGRFGGSLRDIPAAQLGAIAIREALNRAGVKPEDVDEVIMGNVLTSGQGQNPARQAAMYAGIPKEVPAFTVNKVCASSLRAIALAAQTIKAGDNEVVVAGGQENMSWTPYAVPTARWGSRMGEAKLVDLMIYDGIWEKFNDYHMGVTAENIADKWGISREDQDAFAARSENKAERSIKEGVFKEEIVPVEIPQRKGPPVVFDTDEYPTFGTTVDSLAKLRPAFKPDGTVTAGNASGINDGAAAVVVMSRKKADELGKRPMVRIVSYAAGGVDPAYMGTGPVPAVRKALAKAGLTVADIDYWELNEAFASQALYCIRELGIDEDRLNHNGGAISLGHPIGASGARIFVTMLYQMKRIGAKLGCATMCIGGGMGYAIIVENNPT